MTISNISSEVTGPILDKFNVWLSGSEEIKVCLNDPGHMTNVVVMPIDSKNLYKSSFLESMDRWTYNLIYGIGYLSIAKIVHIATLG